MAKRAGATAFAQAPLLFARVGGAASVAHHVQPLVRRRGLPEHGHAARRVVDAPAHVVRVVLARVLQLVRREHEARRFVRVDHRRRALRHAGYVVAVDRVLGVGCARRGACGGQLWAGGGVKGTRRDGR